MKGWGGVGWVVMKGWGGVGHVGIHIQLFMSDSTQKIITRRVLFTNGYKGMCMSRGKFLKP